MMRYFQRTYDMQTALGHRQLSDDFDNIWAWFEDAPVSWDWDNASTSVKSMVLITMDDDPEYLIKFKLNFSEFVEVESRDQYDRFYLSRSL